jgi:hypothetical protein
MRNRLRALAATMSIAFGLVLTAAPSHATSPPPWDPDPDESFGLPFPVPEGPAPVFGQPWILPGETSMLPGPAAGSRGAPWMRDGLTAAFGDAFATWRLMAQEQAANATPHPAAAVAGLLPGGPPLGRCGTDPMI